MRIQTTVLLLAAATLPTLPASASAAFVHVVLPGESLSSIATIDGLSVSRLAEANGLPPTAELIAGSELIIPPQGGPRESPRSEAVAPSEPSPGEESSPTEAEGEASYSEEAGPREASSARAGDGDEDSDDGERGETSTSSVVSTASPATSQPVGQAAEGTPGGPPYPTAEMVSQAQVASIAAANGVPPSLASAIAYMESGFNNALVSSANARGVMQITPGTWSWIDQELAGAAPLSPSSAIENVRAGVLLLHSLLQATNGNEALAISGYYQGLPSVLENGVYPSTQQYVNDVQALRQRFGGG